MGGEKETVIHLNSYNILNGSNGRLESALQGTAQVNLDLLVFKETNIRDEFHTRVLAGYHIFAPIRHCRGVTVL